MKKFKIIAGPCVIESYDHCMKMAHEICEISKNFTKEVSFYFKSSFDKANRSSIKSYRGVKIDEALRVFKDVKKEFNLPVVTDIHTPQQAEELSDVIDVLQIPAFLCRQTDLLLASGKTNKTVNIKKGQFIAPLDMKHCVEKVKSTGNTDVWITERGTSFGYNNLVVDMRSLPIMSNENKVPIIFDATHSNQLPGGGQQTGGQREFIPHLARAATASGVDGLFLEVHDNPKEALSDSTTQLEIDKLPKIIEDCLAIARIVS